MPRPEPDLLPRLIAACWPGGGADRTDAAARGWLRRWQPAASFAPAPACSCASGRCGICN